MNTKLEPVVMDFLARRLGAQPIDALDNRPEHHGLKQADFLWRLGPGLITIEVKRLATDRRRPLQTLLERWRRQHDWPLVYGETDFHDLVRIHGRGALLQREVNAVMRKPVRSALENANRQIRETKEFYGTPDAMGLVMFLNDDIDVFDPRMLGLSLAEMIREGGADRRFESVDSVMLFNWAHRLVDVQGRPSNAIIWSCAADLTPEEQAESVEVHVIREFSAFIQRGLAQGGALREPEDYANLKIEGNATPMTLDAPWHPYPDDPARPTFSKTPIA